MRPKSDPCDCQKCQPMPGYRGFKAAVNRERAETTVRTSQAVEQRTGHKTTCDCPECQGLTDYLRSFDGEAQPREEECEHVLLMNEVSCHVAARNSRWQCVDYEDEHGNGTWFVFGPETADADD